MGYKDFRKVIETYFMDIIKKNDLILGEVVDDRVVYQKVEYANNKIGFRFVFEYGEFSITVFDPTKKNDYRNDFSFSIIRRVLFKDIDAYYDFTDDESLDQVKSTLKRCSKDLSGRMSFLLEGDFSSWMEKYLDYNGRY